MPYPLEINDEENSDSQPTGSMSVGIMIVYMMQFETVLHF
ncbi:unnamed protein product [Wuchereria bancrofti]|uniref:Uncharacterized protein n=1 Tax=Wuchereria bancrofti TaxID=6293 RepID=A0A3P7GKY3_WUCBA|nr:unnamed protein product [Wuchereria bancrofti]